MRTVTLVMLIISMGLLSAQTVISGNINGVWNVDGSPYIITSNVTIAPGDTLIIMPGTRVEFAGRYQLVVDSSAVLKAIGTHTDSIIFTGREISEGWYGIKFFKSAPGCTIAYTEISGVVIYESGDIYNSGGGIYVNETSPVIHHSRIYDCSAGYYGGGITLVNSGTEIFETRIENNSALYGGGGISVHQHSTAIIRNNIITGNTVTGTGYGGGIASYYSDISISNNYISNNQVSNGSGGGIYIARNNSDIIGNTISENSATSGGGIFTLNSNVNIQENEIINNTVQQEGGGIYDTTSVLIIDGNLIDHNTSINGNGGGIVCKLSENIQILNNDITNNNSPANGGGIFANWTVINILDNTINRNMGKYGGGIYLKNSIQENITKNEIRNNRASIGGGIYSANSNITKIVANKIEENSTIDSESLGQGGGIYIASTENPSIMDNIFTENSSSTDGAGIFALDCSRIKLMNNTIVSNSATGFGGGLYLENSSILVGNSIVYWNSPEEIKSIGSTVYIAYSDVMSEGIDVDEASSLTEGEGFISSEPLFADEFFNLELESPCIDAGAESIYVSIWDVTVYGNQSDMYGVLRPQLDGWDIGALEYEASEILAQDNHKPEKMDLIAYPNPFNSEVNVQVTCNAGDNIQIEVFDMMGKKVQTLFSGQAPSDNFNSRWNADNNQSGTYIIKYSSPNSVNQQKINLIK